MKLPDILTESAPNTALSVSVKKFYELSARLDVLTSDMKDDEAEAVIATLSKLGDDVDAAAYAHLQAVSQATKTLTDLLGKHNASARRRAA